ncbi:hypothetical protein ATCC90586_004117 [Pythium insidiosum]|nr:hypothetical protein ATCC90586_004117 [Pythium insidiosum]
MAEATSSGAQRVEPSPAVAVGPHNFEKLRLLGAGSTGRVYLVRSVGLGPEAYYAMKVVSKRELERRNRVQRVLTERDLLTKTNHPFIVTLHYSFETTDYFYLILQYCAGGELFSFLRRSDDHCIPEAHARFYAAEVLVALEYLHLLGIIYRDLKPENILIHESGHVVLSDFDLAYQVKPAVQTASSAPATVKHRSSLLTRSASYSSLVQANMPPHFGASPTKLKAKKPAAPRARAKSPRRLLLPLSPTLSTTDRGLGLALPLQRRTKLVDVPLDTGDRAERARGYRRLFVPRAIFRRLSSPCLPFAARRATLPLVDTEFHMEFAEKRTSFVGTHEYVAPEVIAEEGYVGSVDWWAFGILLYEMVFGVTPFRGATQAQTLENIIDICEDISFPEPPKRDGSGADDDDAATSITTPVVSDACKDLIRRLLDKTVSKRLQNPLHIKSHPFFADVVWPLVPGLAAMTPSPDHNFTYTARQQRGQFWTSSEAHRSLSIKLSQLDLQLALEEESEQPETESSKQRHLEESDSELQVRPVEEVSAASTCIQ